MSGLCMNVLTIIGGLGKIKTFAAAFSWHLNVFLEIGGDGEARKALSPLVKTLGIDH